MRNILAVMVLFSHLAFAQDNNPDTNSNTSGSAQGYMLLGNGHLVSTKSHIRSDSQSMFNMYEGLDTFYGPTDFNAQKSGTNFVISDMGMLRTINAHGFFSSEWAIVSENPQVNQYRVRGNINHVGGNFFITSEEEIHTVDSAGYLSFFKKGEDAEVSDINLSDVVKVGGMYFFTASTVRAGEVRRCERRRRRNPDSDVVCPSANESLVLVGSNGKIFKAMDGIFSHKVNEIKNIGHNYFITKDGTLYTVGMDSVDSSLAKAKLYKTRFKFEDVTLFGGNYFFSKEGYLVMITDSGNVVRGPRNIVNSNGEKMVETPKYFGSNYFVYQTGEVFIVARSGDYAQVGTLVHRFRQTNFRFNR